MEKISIWGQEKLSGEVRISGSKNAALPIIVSSLLTKEGINIFNNVPQLEDIVTIKTLLQYLGAKFELVNQVTIKIDCTDIQSLKVPYDLVKTMRASILVLGPLLARFGKAEIFFPGGCAIGERPIDFHIKALEKMGAQINIFSGYLEAKAKQLHGTKIRFDFPTVTGTENIIMAACLASGRTIIENCAQEPEITNLICVLNSMGANIKYIKNNVIVINGVKTLCAVEANIIPDRIEAGTFIIAAGITEGELLIRNCVPEHLEFFLQKIIEIGMSVFRTKNSLKVKGNKNIFSTKIVTLPYPGFPTDLQAQIMAYLSIASGTSKIEETIFENRFMHVNELKKMGAKIKIKGRNAIIKGINELQGAQVIATDLRASASLILAALAAKGRTDISKIYHIDRGYEKIEKKLITVGAKICRFKK